MFAISNFRQCQYWVHMGNRGSMLVWKRPVQFKKMIVHGDITIMDYDVEEITKAMFETYREFGIPMVEWVDHPTNKDISYLRIPE